uniref:piggyBac transposable element-derived protein 3-like n=1 Tax=Myxine glutinosa TaxID=7769 RepID=UPI00358E1344
MSLHTQRRRNLNVHDVISQLDGDVSDFGDDSESEADDDDLYLPIHDPDDSEDQDDVASIDHDDDSDGLFSDSDDVPLADVAAKAGTSKKTQKRKYTWCKTDFQPPDQTFRGPEFPEPYTDDDGTMHTPLQYFRMFITEEMLQLIVDNTNQYSLQKNGVSVKSNIKEIEQVLGMILLMGVVQMPGVRVYWEAATRFAPVADIMSRNRFQLILRSLHFVDNEGMDAEAKNDKLWKVRPILAMFREQCLKIVPGKEQSIDEMMVAFKGSFSGIKQYMKGKPTKWGFKIWARCSVTGLLHDFDVYQGKNNAAREKSPIGVGGDVIVNLCETLQKHNNYNIFADNLFTSMALLEKMKSDGFQYTGTVRKNRLSGCTLDGEKAMTKRGRGTYDCRVEKDTNIVCVRWIDTKPVTLMSTCTGPEPLDMVRRWDKKKKDFVEVPRPNVIKEYNENMGGIHLMDSCISRYKYPLKSRRWYIYLFWQFVGNGVVTLGSCTVATMSNCEETRSKHAIFAVSRQQLQPASSKSIASASEVDQATPVGVLPNHQNKFVGHRTWTLEKTK